MPVQQNNWRIQPFSFTFNEGIISARPVHTLFPSTLLTFYRYLPLVLLTPPGYNFKKKKNLPTLDTLQLETEFKRTAKKTLNRHSVT